MRNKWLYNVSAVINSSIIALRWDEASLAGPYTQMPVCGLAILCNITVKARFGLIGFSGTRRHHLDAKTSSAACQLNAFNKANQNYAQKYSIASLRGDIT